MGFYYIVKKKMVIPQHSKELDAGEFPLYDLPSDISSIQVTHAHTFLILFNKHKLLDKIIEFSLRKRIREYQYSGKGNLARKVEYPEDGLHAKIITHYDYSEGSSKVHEIRFYAIDTGYTRKDLYDKREQRIQIIYYYQGIPYCKEFLDKTGALHKVYHYSDAGLKI